MSLPDWFCWTRFGVEAGQGVQQILTRKEQERQANGGIYFWGIGNAIGPSLVELLNRTETPEVIFSPIRSAPRLEDVSPQVVVEWTEAFDLMGQRYLLPEESLIISRLGTREGHYALVCSGGPLLPAPSQTEKIPFNRLSNLLTGRPVGYSQVTAVVRCHLAQSTFAEYDIAFRARLIPPYLLRLRRPRPHKRSDQKGLSEN